MDILHRSATRDNCASRDLPKALAATGSKLPCTEHHACGRNGAACGAGCHPTMGNVPYHPSMKEDEYERGA